MNKLALLALTGMLLAAVGPEEGPEGHAASSTKRLQELRAERSQLLKSAAETSMRLAETGRIEVSEALEDQLAALDVGLEDAATRSERVAVLQQTADTLKALEAMAKAQKEAARGTELSLLRIKAKRLGVEIQLEEARGE